MRVRSWTGAALATAYVVVFAGAYLLYLQRSGQWFADLPVVTAAMPFLFVARALSGGDYSFSGDMTGAVVEAATFGAALAYVCGWAIETAARILWRALRGRKV
jgi:hypothetical protein